MQRAHGSADAATAAAVAPLLQLKRAARKAQELSRFARAVELSERALAAAELALPADSLIIAALLHDSSMARQNIFMQTEDVSTLADANVLAMAADEAELRKRSLHLLHAGALASWHAVLAHGGGGDISAGERVSSSACADVRRVLLHRCRKH
jgi:hypothetical protein